MSAMVELESWLVYQYVAGECGHCLFMTESAFKARDIGLRAQKKILSRMAGKNIARAFIDDTTASLLDNLYRLAKQYSNNKKEAEKLVKNVIKVAIKVGVLHRNGLLSNGEDAAAAQRLRSRLRAAAMAVVSFHEVEFTYDRAYLATALADCRAALLGIAGRHLTDKSAARVTHVFGFFADGRFLDEVFGGGGGYGESLARLAADLGKALDGGEL